MKITTVIPAYKSQYLLELLAGLVQQTEAPERIIFSDDSPDQSFTHILNNEPVKSLVAHLNISVIQGPRRGAHANWAQCVQAWGGETELLHILCDDDIIYPQFYARHKQAHRLGIFSSTVSRRWYANEVGQPVCHSLNVPDIVANHPQRMLSLDANLLFTMMVASPGNWLGEVSNTVMRAEVAHLIVERQYQTISFAGLEDLGSFLCGALTAPLCYINEHLGFFRQSAHQNSAKTMAAPIKCSIFAFIALGILGYRLGQITAEQRQSCLTIVSENALWHYQNEADTEAIRAALPALLINAPGAEEHYLKTWNAFVDTHGNF